MLTIRQQIILCELLVCYLNKRSNRITRKEILLEATKNNVDIGNDGSFFRDVKILEEIGYVKRREYQPQRVYYQLTTNGWCFANILGCQKNSSNRYRQVAKEIVWLP